MRGLTRSWLKHYAAAQADFSEAIRIRDGISCFYVDRAHVNHELHEYAAAAADLTRAMEFGATQPRVYLDRSRAYAALGNTRAAAAEVRVAFQLPPRDYQDWAARGRALKDSDPAAAIVDFDRALELNPTSQTVLFQKALVLAKKMWRTDDAVLVLDRAIKIDGRYAPMYAARALMYARRGEWAQAREDLTRCRLRDEDVRTWYLAAGVYSLLSSEQPADRANALKYLRLALQAGCDLGDVETDRDFELIRNDPEFRRLLENTAVRKRGESGSDL